MKLMERVFIKKENIKSSLINTKNKIVEFFSYLWDKVYIKDTFKRTIVYIGLTLSILGILLNQILEFLILYVVIVTLLYIGREYEDYKARKIIDSLDVFKMGMDDNSLSHLLDSYIDDCFTRDVLFFKGVHENMYVNEKLENMLRDELLNSVIKNMSPYIRTKLDYYYGKGNTDIIIGRKCFIKVAMFAATINKTIYTK